MLIYTIESINYQNYSKVLRNITELEKYQMKGLVLNQGFNSSFCKFTNSKMPL